MFRITSYQRNAKKKHNDISLYPSHNDCHLKIKKQKNAGEDVD